MGETVALIARGEGGGTKNHKETASRVVFIAGTGEASEETVMRRGKTNYFFLSDKIPVRVSESDRTSGSDRDCSGKTPAGVPCSVIAERCHVQRRGVAESDPGLFKPGDWSQFGIAQVQVRKIHIPPLARKQGCFVLSSPTVPFVPQLCSFAEQWP